MNHTEQLIKQVELLLQLIAGTEASQSQTVIEINDLIGKVRKQEAERESIEAALIKKLVEINEELTKLNNLAI